MGANYIDLTTVAAVNNLLSQTAGTDAALIQSEVTNLSRYILTRTSRSYLGGFRFYNETYNGNGSDILMLKNYPILSVASLVIGNTNIPESPDTNQSGWVIDTSGSGAALALRGWGRSTVGFSRWSVGDSQWSGYGNAPPLGQGPYSFYEGVMNVAVQYTAGFLLDAYSEQHIVPSSPPYDVTVGGAATFWADEGVSLPNGAPVTGYNVMGGQVQPTAGQAQTTADAFLAIQGLVEILGPSVVVAAQGAGIFNPSTAGVPTPGFTPGVYTFPSSLAGQTVLISYQYGGIPQDLFECVTKVVATYYRRPKYLDQSSQMQPGIGTTAYNRSEWAPECVSIIDAYKRRFLD